MASLITGLTVALLYQFSVILLFSLFSYFIYRVDHKVGQFFFFLKVSKIKKKNFSSAKYSHNLKI
jgi:hypothetical protein